MNPFSLPDIPPPLLSTLRAMDADILFLVPHGSTLYGTSTPSSDKDLVAVYLPTPLQIALQIKPKLEKLRFTKDGALKEAVGKASSDSDTIEVEFLSFPDLISGFILGTPKEVEIACYLQVAKESVAVSHFTRYLHAVDFLSRVGDQMKAIDIKPMLSFAKKNVDFITERGNRYKTYETIRMWVQKCYLEGCRKNERVDRNLLLDLLRQKIPGVSPSKLSGGHVFYVFESGISTARSLADLDRHAAAQMAGYGDRTIRAVELGHDTKGLGHGIRCLIQAKEILLTGLIRYPLKEAELLVKVKTEGMSPEEAQRILLEKFAEIQSLLTGLKNYGVLVPQSQEAAYKYVSTNMLAFYQLLFKDMS